MPEMFPGALAGVVRDNSDPLGCGRVKAYVPAIGDPYISDWLKPMGWPGAGAPSFGSQYPIPLDAQVVVFFEQGNPHAGGWFIPGHYGAEKGVNQGPSQTQALQLNYGPRAALKCTTLYEDANFRIYIERHKVGEDADKRQVVIEEKKRGSYITFDASAGEGKKSVDISIYSATGVSITADGNIDISARNVQIQGRRVLRGKKTI